VEIEDGIDEIGLGAQLVPHLIPTFNPQGIVRPDIFTYGQLTNGQSIEEQGGQSCLLSTGRLMFS